MTVKELRDRLNFLLKNKHVKADNLMFIATSRYKPVLIEGVIVPPVELIKKYNKLLNVNICFVDMEKYNKL